MGDKKNLGEIAAYNTEGFYQGKVTETEDKISSTPLLILQIFVGHLLFARHCSWVMGHSSELIITKSLLLMESMLWLQYRQFKKLKLLICLIVISTKEGGKTGKEDKKYERKA